MRCLKYFQDCQQFLSQNNKNQSFLESLSPKKLPTSKSNYFGMKKIPYYFINRDGQIKVGREVSGGIGVWGAGVAVNQGVRDYWSETTEVGANWIEGKYGVKSGWSVPLVQSLGVEGGKHTMVGFESNLLHFYSQSVSTFGKNCGNSMRFL
ncbi:unnamed protein product [Caenorhabditis angaria]|uniref:Uncharacterized protein n=1 Tax=Caenorhabditis angaria TaxID=860376 RepID=A0A9P1IC73_9PELO|nr:unnamed protein product [Caenorhabditis angaria]